MERSIQMYNAFSGVNSSESFALLQFFRTHAPEAESRAVQEALDYALKNKPSFGGFVLTYTLNNRIVAGIVVNKTGMEGFKSDNLLVLAALHEDHTTQNLFLEELICKAIDYTDGDIAIYARPNHPALMMAKRIGFKEQFVELKFQKAAVATKVRV
jgi:hypothetical protein